MNFRLIWCLVCLVCTSLPSVATAQADDPFKTNIRPTEPLSPSEEQRTFQLPPGFEIQVFASEPEIAKPLNMAFDARGRLWLTNTVEYPYPAPPDRPGRDSVKILEDTNGDGRADKVTTFAEGLNVPIGLYPYDDGAIVFSIPYIWRIHDTDGDGKADRREKLFGPMAYDRDTHGLNNAFRRDFDGWLRACHGFNNITTVAGKDGHEITMQSGNTYRMRLDGSRIEHFTWGQVNPFGMVIDELGNTFTADCHSKPIYQLLRGAYYPSFGRPHDGLGFVPPMMEHGHGSTAICGIAVYDAPNFPPEYRGNIFTGNVMTSRVNRDSLVYHGTTIEAKEEPDFLSTTDPWFRPVDIQLGPDGALYVADFYNRIIGHYEVPLDHPGRDRKRGRIWRITYTGKDSEPTGRLAGLMTDSPDKLIAALSDDNLTRRTLALNELADHGDRQTIAKLQDEFANSTDPHLRTRVLWILFRRGMLNDEILNSAATDKDRGVRVHAMKVLSETPNWSSAQRSLAIAGLSDEDAFVQRAAADALGQHPDVKNIRPLLDQLPQVPEADNHLRHVVRMALRNQLRVPGNFAGLQRVNPTVEEQGEIASLCISLKSPQAGVFLVQYVAKTPDPSGDVAAYMEHAARYLPAEEMETLVNLARRRFSADVDLQFRLLTSLRTGLERRGAPLNDSISDWAGELAGQLLDSVEDGAPQWAFSQLSDRSDQVNPFGLRKMPSSDGDRDTFFIDSKARGERPTGVFRSPTFDIPEKLSFYLSGHLGAPDRPVVRKNFVRLRDAEDGRILAESVPPRNDIATRVDWDLKKSAGSRGYLEIVDGISAGGYAWLAVGRIQPAVVGLPSIDPALTSQRRSAAADLVGQFHLEKLKPRLAEFVTSETGDLEVRERTARALVALSPDTRLAALVPTIGDPTVADPLRQQVCQVVVSRDVKQIQAVLAAAMKSLARRPQELLAEALAADAVGAETLMTLIEAGQAPPQLLQNQTVRQSLAAVKLKGSEQRIEKLTAGLPAAAEEIVSDIAARLKAFSSDSASAERGLKVFEKNCSVCHKVGNLGKVVGPQLDGIGNRGLERIVEDMLDPNRNVDVAFRTTTLALDSGKVLSGLFRREEGAVLVLVNNKGEEFTVPKKEVDEQIVAQTSLMPVGLTKPFSQADFNDLIAFLLAQTMATEPASK